MLPIMLPHTTVSPSRHKAQRYMLGSMLRNMPSIPWIRLLVARKKFLWISAAAAAAAAVWAVGHSW